MFVSVQGVWLTLSANQSNIGSLIFEIGIKDVNQNAEFRFIRYRQVRLRERIRSTQRFPISPLVPKLRLHHGNRTLGNH
ncbi:hypothetical protein D1AOALGA4SA_12910 [Olavius algarvensis Delta 1 endosymbiont]|nr:hypothetical protein D1AOALGA4SA_12910 [Olavius algarvensis Delta 1 endosymbiont]